MPNNRPNSDTRYQDGWFYETSEIWPGIAISIEIEKVLFSGQSQYQKIDLYQTRHHGRMLVLDGVIQLTDFDEFAYQEMLTHIPLFAHPSPRRLLVIGGGDGGVLREAGRHPKVEQMDLCEIDGQVIDISKRFLPDMSIGFNDPRVTVHVADGSQFIAEHPGEYDVIIVDSSDPVGPGEALFEGRFYELCKKALKPGGILALQGESFLLHPKEVNAMVHCIKSLFSRFGYAYAYVPTFTGGHIGFCIGSDGPDPAVPVRSVPAEFQARLRYYSADIHKAAFVLPHFARQMMETA